MIAADDARPLPRAARRRIADYLRAQPRPARQHRRPARARRRRPPHPVARQRGQAAAHPRRGCSTRTASSARTASARSRAATSTSRTCSTSKATSTGCSTSRPSRRRACSAATPTGAGRCGSRQPADHPGPAAALPLLRRRLHDRVPDRLGQRDDAVRGGPGDRRAGSSPRSCATPTARRPVYGGTERFQDDPHWRDLSCSTSTSTATTAPASAPRTRPAGPGSWRRSIQLFGHLDAESAARTRRPSARPAVPTGDGRVDRRRRDGPRGARRPPVRLPAEPGRPRDLHLGLARRPVGARRAARSRWPTCPPRRGTTSPGPASTPSG